MKLIALLVYWLDVAEFMAARWCYRRNRIRWDVVRRHTTG